MTRSPEPAVFEALVENSQDQLVYLDRDFNFVWVNRAYADTCRRPAEDFVGRNHFELYPHAENQAIFAAVRDTGVPAAWREKPFVFPDQPDRGVTYWDWTLRPVKDAAGTVRGLVFSLRDVTDEVEARERYRSLFASMREGYALYELIYGEAGQPVDYRFLDVNPAFGRLTGLEPAEVVGRTVREVLPNLEPAWIRVAARVVETGASERFESRSGLLGRWYEVFAFRPAPGRFAVSVSDLTESKYAEEELRRVHDRAASLARFAEENPEPVLRVAHDLTLVYANAAAQAALGALGALEVGQPILAELADGTRRALESRGGAKAELRCAGRVFSMTFSAIGPEVSVYGHEITEAKRAVEALRESERVAEGQATELQAVLDTVPAAVWIARDRSGDWIDTNRFGAELLRRPPGSNVSVTAASGERPTNLRMMRHGRELSSDELPMQAAARFGTESTGYELDVMFDDGTVRHLLGNATPLRDGLGEPWGAVGAFIDITERKEAELRLREASRRKDEFLGMLSHELRNPLAPIRNSLYILGRIDARCEQAQRCKATIERQVVHLTRLVDDLLDVTRVARGKIELRRVALDLVELASRTVEDHRSLLEDRGLSLHLELPEDSVWVDGDPTRLAQVVGNLLQNSAKFTAEGGEVTVSLRAVDHAAELAVVDTGAGIERDLLPQIFEPFVQGDRTLARTEGGLGLGLALVKGIADLHGGSVRAESDGRGRGAAFFVRLPLGDPDAGVLTPAARS